MNIIQNFNSAGYSSSYSSHTTVAEKTRISQINLQEIHNQINLNRQKLYILLGFNGVQVTSATFNNDMNTIQKQFNFITQRKNQQFIIHLKEQLLVYYDKILELKQLFIKRMNYIRKQNIVSPEIVKYAITIEKYFEIKSDPISDQDDEDIDNLEIPSELY